MVKAEAELLVKCGYAADINEGRIAIPHRCGEFGDDVDWEFREVDPYADTLEGRRQADALEDWLVFHCRKEMVELGEKYPLWTVSDNVDRDEKSNHQWRLDRIKWCCEQLGDKCEHGKGLTDYCEPCGRIHGGDV